MTMIRPLFLAVALVAGQAQAQTAGPAPGEVAFWESVRDSKNPEELRAYLQTFPNGMFAPIARARLAALGARPAPSAPKPASPGIAPPSPSPATVASTAPASVTAATRMPQAGDTWVYTLSYPRLRGQWGQENRLSSNYVVKVGGVNEGRITDQISVDGGTVSDVTHSRQPTLAPQGVSLFSPYLVALRDLPQRGSIGSVTSLDSACAGPFACEASARVLGAEVVQLPAGTFNAVKVAITQEWRGASVSDPRQAAQMIGGRTVTVWYVPEIKRAVKVQSRLTAGDVPPVDSNFDLDLVSYQVK
jgi:hypothetical protein